MSLTFIPSDDQSGLSARTAKRKPEEVRRARAKVLEMIQFRFITKAEASKFRKAVIARRNGRHTNGPTTPEGKATSSRNALKHGFSARKYPSPLQDLCQVEQNRSGLLQDFTSAGKAGALLIDQLAWEFAQLDVFNLVLGARNYVVQAAAIGDAYDDPDPKIRANIRKCELGRYDSQLEELTQLISDAEAGNALSADLPKRLSNFFMGEVFEGIDFSDRELLLEKLRLCHSRVKFVIASLLRLPPPLSIRAFAALAPTDLDRYRSETMRNIKRILRELMKLQEWHDKQREAKKKRAQSGRDLDGDGDAVSA